MKPFSLLLVLTFLPLSALFFSCGGSGRADGDTETENDTETDGDTVPDGDYDPDPDEAPCTLTHCPVGPVCVSSTYLVTVIEEHDICEEQQCRGERRYCLDGCVDQPVAHCEGDVLDGDREDEEEIEPDEDFDLIDGDEDFEMPELMPCETLVSYRSVHVQEAPVSVYGENAVFVRTHYNGSRYFNGLHVFNITTKHDSYLRVGDEPIESLAYAAIWESTAIVGTEKGGRDPYFQFKLVDIHTGGVSPLQFTIASGSYAMGLWTDGVHIAYQNIFFGSGGKAPGLLNMLTGDVQRLCELPNCELRGFSNSRLIWSDSSSSWFTESPNYSWDIYVYDIQTKQKQNLTADRYAQDMPSIDGHYAVWHDCRYDDNLSNAPNECDMFDIYLYNLDTNDGSRITSSTKRIWHQSPWINNGRVVWTRTDKDQRANTAMLFDIATNKTFELFNNGCYSRPYLTLFGDKMFYIEQGCRTVQTDSLYMYDLACHFARKGK